MQKFGIATIQRARRDVVAVTTDRGILPLAELVPASNGNRRPPGSVRELLPQWDRWCGEIEDALSTADDAKWVDESAVHFRTPLPDAPTVYGAGANYVDHVKEMGADPPREPFHFVLPGACLSGHRDPVVRPAGCTQLDWEVELAAIIGKRADCVSEADALSYVAGYAVANDVSMRDRDRAYHEVLGVRWLPSKGQAGLQPVGPSIVPTRFIPDPMDLELSLTVNGAVRQQSSTRQMIFSVGEQIAYLSRMVPLQPGDLILTGTPAGTAVAFGQYLEDGDLMVATVAGIGQLTNQVVASHENRTTILQNRIQEF